jgi:hypothetical protein
VDLVEGLVERRKQAGVKTVEEHLPDKSGVAGRGLPQRLLALGG